MTDAATLALAKLDAPSDAEAVAPTLAYVRRVIAKLDAERRVLDRSWVGALERRLRFAMA